jgi:hypothetical protein
VDLWGLCPDKSKISFGAAPFEPLDVIPNVPKMNFEGDGWDYLRSVANAGANIVNDVTGIADYALSNANYIGKNGLVSYGQLNLERTVNGAVDVYNTAAGKVKEAYDYVTKTSIQQKKDDAVNAFISNALPSPKQLEGKLTIAGEILLAEGVGSLAGSLRAPLKISNAGTGTGIAPKAPDFVVTPNGQSIIIPKNATGPLPAANSKGFQFSNGAGGNGLSINTTGVRVMDPSLPSSSSPGYPGGYVNYLNSTGQSVNPYTGNTISKSDPMWHIPL